MRKRSTIFKKYMMFIVIAGMLPLIASAMVMFRYYEANLLDNTMSSVTYMLNYLSDNITKVADEINTTMEEIKGSEETGSLIKLLRKEQGAPLSPEENNEKSALIEKLQQKALDANAYTKGAVFIDANRKVYGKTRTLLLFNNGYNCEYDATVQNIFDGTITDSELPAHIADYYKDDTRVFSYIIRFEYVEDEQRTLLGVMLADVYIEAVGTFFENVDRNMMGILYLADYDGNCIYSINKSWIGRKIYEFETHKQRSSSVMGGVRRVFSANKIENTPWTLVCGVNEQYLFGRINSIKAATMLTLALGLAACLLLSLFGTRRMARPIGKILNAMQKVRDGNLDVAVEIKQHDEIGQIADEYNRMLARMKEYIEKVYVLQLSQREAELNALKTQIQPHFLYNTLEVIRMNAISNGDGETAEMIRSLAQQFRYLLASDDNGTTVDDEIEIIHEYFKIINVRYMGKIKLETEIAEAARSVKIPRLTLQILVENSVMHGLRESGGIIKIRAAEEKESFVIEVIDTGKGMSAEQLERIKCSLDENKSPVTDGKTSTGLGIKNVYERIKMIYGSRVEFNIHSIEAIGTSVRIEIAKEDSDVQTDNC